MNNLIPSLHISSLEIGVLVLMLIVLVFDLIKSKLKTPFLFGIAILGLISGLIFLIGGHANLIGSGFSNFYSTSKLDLFFKGTLLSGSLFVILMLASSKEKGESSGESILLILLATLGALFVVSSNELITLFLSIEILSFASYILTAYIKTNKASGEAGTKYLILGGLSSGFLLFGVAIIYGILGTTQFDVIQESFFISSSLPLWIGFLLIGAGIAFKMGIFPFCFWIPDVYQGAPTWVGGFLSTVSKAVGFVAFIKLIYLLGGSLGAFLYFLIGVLAILTALYGNIGAVLQDNLKRLLGYSSIAQASYLLLALTNPSTFALKSVIFYLIVYTISNLLVFSVIYLANLKSETRAGLNGLSQKSFLLACALFIGLTSLAGIPPMVGFIGKFVLFLSAFQAKAYTPIAFALAGVLVSIFYYLRIIKAAFVKIPQAEVKYAKIRLSPLAIIMISALSLFVVFLGVYPAATILF